MAANPQDFSQDGKGDGKSVLVKMRNIVQRLQSEADDRVGRRLAIEERWLLDLAQFHGKYDDQITKSLKEAKRSSLYINQTRAKTNAMEARLSDMLFPTDDRNWGIGPTPVPELTVDAERTARAAADAKILSADNPNNPQHAANADTAVKAAQLIQDRLKVARDRAHSMEEEIDDHLRECKYSIQAREIIRDGCKIGTGVLKGPVSDGSTRRAWKPKPPPVAQTPADGVAAPAQPGGWQRGEYELTHAEDQRAVFWRVDPWNFFPDMDAATMDESESTFERHLFNRKQLQRLAKQSGFDKEAIRRLLVAGPQGTAPYYLAQLRSITGDQVDLGKNRFHTWEYHGPLTVEDIEELAFTLGREELLDDVPDVDPLEEVQVTVWFCQGEPLKFALHHLDSGDPLYSVFNLEKDETTVFGYGVPYIMRDPQKALSAAWRALMDNMGISSGPQIVINEEVIEPANGSWVLEPRKIWRRKGTAPADKKPFEIFNIDSHIGDLTTVIELSKRNIDEETALPMIAQGDQGAQVTKTFQGMAILMNSVNVVFRRIVKNWDDDVTVPSIGRLYDWLMQFSPKEYIKGDYKVDARGTSVLLVREMQSQNLMMFLTSFSGHPLLGKYLKDDGLPALRKLGQTLLISADELIKDDTEIARDDMKRASEPPPPNPEMEAIAQQLNLEKMRGENALELEAARRETALIQLAPTLNMKLEDLKAKLADKQADRTHKERIFAAEAAIEASKPADEGGSGGYLS